MKLLLCTYGNNHDLHNFQCHVKIPVNEMLVFSVKDYGKGIEEKYRNDLFKRYFQIPTDGQHKSGSGLGLSISKDFIEAQQGQIWLESELGEGSRFSFSSPTNLA